MKSTQNDTTAETKGFKGMNIMTTLFACAGPVIIILFVYIPIVLFLTLDFMQSSKQISTYFIFSALIILITIVGFYLARFLYRSIRRKIVNRLHPMEFVMLEDFMTYPQADSASKPTKIGTISYNKMKACIISGCHTSNDGNLSRLGDSIIKPVKFLIDQHEYNPQGEDAPINIAIHIVYTDEETRSFYSCHVADAERADELLGHLQAHAVPLKWTSEDISSIPRDDFAYVVTEELTTANLPYNGSIKEFLYSIDESETGTPE